MSDGMIRYDHSRWIAEDATLPHVLMRPRLFIDGNQWCALYGSGVQGGVAGFGSSPRDAMCDFDSKWSKRLSGGGDSPETRHSATAALLQQAAMDIRRLGLAMEATMLGYASLTGCGDDGKDAAT